MRATKLTAMCLACAAAFPALAQNTTDSRCGTTNYDRSRGAFTIVNTTPELANQQCFISVVPKESWRGGPPDPVTSEFVEGNYEVALSGGGGGGGGNALNGDKGFDGADARVYKGMRYLSPGVYRLTIGAGGQGGRPCLSEEFGGRGGDGAPTSLSNAYTDTTIAGFDRAQYWDGHYAHNVQVASATRVGITPAAVDGNMSPSARSGDYGGGGHGASVASQCATGEQGGSGFIRLALAEAAPQPAPRPAPQAAPQPAPESTPPPMAAPSRPARRDRN